MGCTLCGNKRSNGYIENKAIKFPPYNAGDIYLIDSGEYRKLLKQDWENDNHKVLVYYNDIYSASNSIKKLEEYSDKFKEINVDIYIATIQSIAPLQYNDYKYKVISSYILASRLGLILNGEVKQANIYISNDGDVVKQEEFLTSEKDVDYIYSAISAFVKNDNN